jgi:nitroimidazol reductase NimA-like FMN-containing flavoprotein (pyridoxamine 5'-phosphate oxidase superfamily)
MAQEKPPTEKERIDTLLVEPLLARLGTANPATCQPHVTPVWFWWDGESVWISAFTSTRKVKELKKNPLCSVLIDKVAEDGSNRAVLFEGSAELVTEPREVVWDIAERIYTRYLGLEGVKEPDPQSWIKDEENLLVKLTPDKTYTWWA